MRILVVTTEPVPFPGCITTGAGLRAWALAQGLRSRGLDADVAMPEDAVAKCPSDIRKRLSTHVFSRNRLTEYVRQHAPDALVMQHWGLMDRLGTVEMPLALDLAGPHLLERRFWGSPHPQRDLEDKLSALRRADFLTCSGHFQRHYFLAFALQAGFDPADPALLSVIPFSVSPELPEPAPADPLDWAYTGMFLPWQDPGAGIAAVLRAMESRGKGTLHFVGSLHPAGHVPLGAFEPIIEQLRRSPRAVLEEARPFEDLQKLLARCGAALDLMAKNPERELAFPSRTVVYLSCGLPVIFNNYSELSHLIAAYDAGWCVDPADEPGIEKLAEHILEHPEEIIERRENARRLVWECLTWDKTITPLAEWCAAPHRRKNTGWAENPKIAQPNEAGRLAEAERALEELHGRRLVKLSNFLRKFRG